MKLVSSSAQPGFLTKPVPLTWKLERAWLFPLLYLMHRDLRRSTTDLRQTTDTNKIGHLRWRERERESKEGREEEREREEGREIRLSRSERDDLMPEEWH